MMDQPTAEDALQKLEPLVGEWRLIATAPGGEPWPGEARASFEWHQSGAHLVARSSSDMPEAPDSISIIGCDAASGTGRILQDGSRIIGRWEKAEDGLNYTADFDLTYVRVE